MFSPLHTMHFCFTSNVSNKFLHFKWKKLTIRSKKKKENSGRLNDDQQHISNNNKAYKCHCFKYAYFSSFRQIDINF